MSDRKAQAFVSLFARKAARIMSIFISVLAAFMLIFVGILWIMSPGKPKPLVDEHGNPLTGSLSEKVFVDVNGVKQGMFIKSKDVNNPVLLYLHGGIPDYFLSEKFPTGLEEIFTVVWWEQRGSGISYSPDIPPDTMTQEQLIADTLVLTDILRHRFGQDKIYLMGHSGGSFIGIQAAARAPELYHAYIGQAQMSYQLESERLAYEYMLAAFKANGNQAMVRKLEATPVSLSSGIPAGYTALRDPAMHALGIGTTHAMDSIITGILLPSFASSDYTLSEKINLWRGKARSGISVVWDTMLITDLSQQVPELAIPVYFLEGIHDYTCSYTLAKDYFVMLKAPIKGFYTFEESAHSPMFEESAKMRKILVEDVLQKSNSLANIQ